jgi:hypothetical protein
MLKCQCFYAISHQYTPETTRGQASPKWAKSPYHCAKLRSKTTLSRRERLIPAKNMAPTRPVLGQSCSGRSVAKTVVHASRPRIRPKHPFSRSFCVEIPVEIALSCVVRCAAGMATSVVFRLEIKGRTGRVMTWVRATTRAVLRPTPIRLTGTKRPTSRRGCARLEGPVLLQQVTVRQGQQHTRHINRRQPEPAVDVREPGQEVERAEIDGRI